MKGSCLVWVWYPSKAMLDLAVIRFGWGSETTRVLSVAMNLLDWAECSSDEKAVIACRECPRGEMSRCLPSLEEIGEHTSWPCQVPDFRSEL